MNWKSYTIDLGTIKQNSKHTLVYESTKPLDIYKISPGCTQCTKINGYSDNKLTAVYKVSNIPIQLRNNPEYQNVRKIIVVTYQDGSKDILSFTAKVIK